eukprot:COSAG01_NODE_568_length_15370_cov_26.058018_2_plen_463_part_00
MNSKKTFKQSFFVLTEEFFVCFNLMKWILLSAGIGSCVGAVVSLFLNVLDLSITQSHQNPYFFFALPFIFMLNRFISQKISPDSQGHGTEKVIKAVHHRSGDIRFRVAPVKFLTTVLTITFGGSAGKEGPSAQIGAALSSTLAKICRFSKEDRKKMVICGVSAGFAAVFGTPIAGAIFGVEVLFVGRLLYGFLLPSLIAGLASFQVCHYLGLHNEFVTALNVPVLTPLLGAKVLLAALLFGLGSLLFIELMRWMHVLSKRYDHLAYTKCFIGGLLLLCCFLSFTKVPLWGLGTATIIGALNGSVFTMKLAALKAFVTGITLSFGGSGGILTPILFVGSTFGSALGHLLNVDIAFFAALGLVSFLAGMANTPIAACLLAIELFGTAFTPFAALCCIISFIVSGSRSVYPAQIMAFQKSDISVGTVGEDVSNQHPHINYKHLRMISKSKRIVKNIKKKVQLSVF